jgi:hypothetical protein
MAEITRKLSLFAIGDELNNVIAAIERAEEEGADPEILAALDEFFAQTITDRDKKLNSYGGLIHYIGALADIAEAEAKRVSALARARRGLEAALKNRLKGFLELNGVTKIATANHVFSVVKNPQESLVINEDTTPEMVDKEFQVITVDFNNAAIRSAIDRGDEVPFARLVRGTHLRVK